jgi:hypothetical protein
MLCSVERTEQYLFNSAVYFWVHMVSVVGEWNMSTHHLRNNADKEYRDLRRLICKLTTTDLIWTDPASKPGLRSCYLNPVKRNHVIYKHGNFNPGLGLYATGPRKMDFFSLQLGKGLVVETSPSQSMFSFLFSFWRKIKSSFRSVEVEISKQPTFSETLVYIF